MQKSGYKKCLGDLLGLLWLLQWISVSEVTGASQKIDRLIACSSEEVQLSCQSNESLLAFHNAFFSTEELFLNTSCYSDIEDIQQIEICSEDIKVSLNNRCAGKNRCSFNFTYDHIDKSCASNGALVIDYACVEQSSILKYCNYPVNQREGYISSPGYPSFFPRLQNCTWNLTAGAGQTIELTLVDLYIRPSRPHYGRAFCDEALTVYDGPDMGGTRLITACGQSPLGTYETTAASTIINFNSEKFTPFRGFLIYYKFQGCPTLPAPKQGYRVSRNGSWALYMCCNNHLFNDTLDNIRPLHCVDGFSWNATVPDCMSIAEIRENGNYSGIDLVWSSSDVTSGSSRSYSWTENNMMADVIIPIALMASLIIGNAVVLIIILKIRRKSKNSDDYCDEDQPKPCSSSYEPNHSEV